MPAGYITLQNPWAKEGAKVLEGRVLSFQDL